MQPSATIAPPSADPRLALLTELIVSSGLADMNMLERAYRVAEDTGRRIDAVLTQLGIVTERRMAETMSTLLGVSLADSKRYPEVPLLPERLRANFLHRAHAIPIAIEAERLVLAMSDPLDTFTPAAIADATDLAVVIEVAVPAELDAALERLYPIAAGEEGTRKKADGRSREALENDTERLKDLASEAPVIRLVNQMIARAVETHASDIHIEPFEDRLRVRYRYDGVMHEEEAAALDLSAAIISRIKIMAQLDIAERRLPQDGRLKLSVRGHDIDFRVSTVPSIVGETVVLRVLDRSAVTLNFGGLGLADNLTRQLPSLLELPNGIVLVTGPTGSGKTTTLYTGLLGLNSVTRKIITVEDPVEYRLTGINQIQVKPQIGLTFAQLLRSILRQDPDVIMIGEIRDIETAQIAVQAALTGHLVLSTLHTNSAAATIIRLRDMGLEEYLITAALRGVLAQRLVRQLCPHCAEPRPASDAMIDRFGLAERVLAERVLAERVSARSIMLYHPIGCAECRQTGYKGRIAIAELLMPNAEIEQLIAASASTAAIEAAAVRNGMRTLFNAGIDAVLAGTTSIEEVLRIMMVESQS